MRDARRLAYRAAGLCWSCGAEVVPGYSRCERHRAANNAHALTRYRRDKARQAESIARRAERRALVVLPEGARPMECEPFRAHAADVTQRLDCARRTGCLNFAVAREWAAFSCASCPVRDVVRVELVTRRSCSETVATWPGLGGALIFARLGEAWPGKAGQGQARQGMGPEWDVSGTTSSIKKGDA